MASFRLRVMTRVLPFLLALPAAAYAQPVQPPSPGEAATALNQAPLTQAQLDQLLAPIALYPDQVLMDVLMASTFPDQVAAAGQWLQTPANAALNGDALVAALQPQPWDPSVKSLVVFPGVIALMNTHLDWTEALGSAFASEQVATMAEVQALRNRALAAHQLASNAQITIVRQGPLILINPTNPGMLYIPVYNPAAVYGPWPYAEYPPVYLPPPPGFVGAGFSIGPGIGFSIGYGIVAPYWNWGRPDWGGRRIVIDPTPYTRITPAPNLGREGIQYGGGTWRRTGPVVPVPAGSRPRPAVAPGPRPPGTFDPAAIRPPGGGRPGTPGTRPPETGPGEARPGEPRPAVVPRPGEPTPGEPRPAVVPRPGEPRPAVVPRPGAPIPGEPRPAVVPRPGEPRPAVVPRPGAPIPGEPRPAVVPRPGAPIPGEPRPAVVPRTGAPIPGEPRPAVVPRPGAPIPGEPRPAVVPEPRPAVVRPPVGTSPPEPRPSVIRPLPARTLPTEKKPEPGN